jgi:hypothetical protein
MAKTNFEVQLLRIEKANTKYAISMMNFRLKQRAREVSLVERSQNKKILAEARKWEKQQRHLEDNGEFDTFFFGNMQVQMSDKNRPVYPTQWNKPRSPPLPAWVPQRLAELRTAMQKVDKAIDQLVKPTLRSDGANSPFPPNANLEAIAKDFISARLIFMARLSL